MAGSTLPLSDHLDQDDGPASAKWPSRWLRRQPPLDRSNEREGRALARPSLDRVSDLLGGRIDVRDRAPLLEVIDRRLGLIGRQNPGRALRFDRAGEVRAEITANEFPADAEFVRNRLGAIGRLRIDLHAVLLRSIDCMHSIYAIDRNVNRSQSILHCKVWLTIDRRCASSRSIVVTADNTIPPPSAYAKEELTYVSRARKSEAGWPCDFHQEVTT